MRGLDRVGREVGDALAVWLGAGQRVPTEGVGDAVELAGAMDEGVAEVVQGQTPPREAASGSLVVGFQDRFDCAVIGDDLEGAPVEVHAEEPAGPDDGQSFELPYSEGLLRLGQGAGGVGDGDLFAVLPFG